MSNNTIVDVIVKQPMTTQQISSYIPVPIGGSSGQVLVKASNVTGDLVWVTNLATGTDLTITNKTSTQFTLNSSSGADVAIPQASITEAGLLIATDKVKLNSLGTASYLNVPASGNAASGEVVKGDDTRLSDARTPLNHTHVVADVTGLQTALDGKQPLTTVLTNTTASFTTTLETKLNGIATGATVNSSDATLLARVNHTGTQLAATISDFNAAADARVVAGITGKEDTITAGTTAQYWRGDKSWQTLDKSAVGLGNIDNTSDATKNAASVTLTNKTISGESNTLTNIAQASVTNLTTDLSNKRPLDTDLTAIAALTGTGLARRTGVDTWSLDSSTYLTGNQTITASGDVSGSGTTAITLNLGSNVVTNAKLAQVATSTFKGRITASTGNVEDLTAAQATSLLDTFTSGTKGLVGASGGGTTNFLRADGTWAAPSGGGGSGNSVTVDVDFGSTFTDKAVAVVTGQSWVTSTSEITCHVLCPTGSDPDEMYLLNIRPVISDLVNSTGFTITLYSEQEAKGIYKVMCIGV